MLYVVCLQYLNYRLSFLIHFHNAFEVFGMKDGVSTPRGIAQLARAYTLEARVSSLNLPFPSSFGPKLLIKKRWCFCLNVTL